MMGIREEIMKNRKKITDDMKRNTKLIQKRIVINKKGEKWCRRKTSEEKSNAQPSPVKRKDER